MKKTKGELPAYKLLQEISDKYDMTNADWYKLHKAIANMETALVYIADQAGAPDTQDFDIVRRECYGWSMWGLDGVDLGGLEHRYNWQQYHPQLELSDGESAKICQDVRPRREQYIPPTRSK